MDNEQKKIQEEEKPASAFKLWLKDGFTLTGKYCLAVVSSLMLFVLAFFSFLDNEIMMICFDVFFIIMIVVSMYSGAARIARHDLQPYYHVKHFPARGFVIGLLPTAVMAILVILWQLIYVPSFFNEVKYGGIPNLIYLVVQFLFSSYTFPFNAFMQIEGNYITWYSGVMIFLIPYLACGIGYLAGYRGFSFYDKYVHPMIYKVQKDKKKNVKK